MKNCRYCGRENPDEARHCQECGTEFIEPTAKTEPAEPARRDWLEGLGRAWCYAALILVAGLLYLLSFGPVERYCAKVSSQTAPPATFAANGQPTVVSVRRVSYPRWVAVIYYPAFLVRSSEGGNGWYARYLQWWEKNPGPS
jgi:hypothetical protein